MVLVRAASVVERGPLGLPLVPHATEDRAGMEADTEADEEGDQRDADACRAIALLWPEVTWSEKKNAETIPRPVMRAPVAARGRG
jgi:hypothetical protein